ncbi:MAG TPA: YIP1 family protein [Candidatus Dormibacteraeota bacterium]
MVASDIAGVLRRPARTFAAMRDGRPLGAAVGVVAGSGIAAALLSVVAALLEQDPAGLGISAFLPLLFASVWLIDAYIVDAVAQLMGVASRLRVWMSVSAFAIPALVAFDAIRVVQAILDRNGAFDVSTGVGFAGFLVLAWFLALIAVAAAAVYGLPALSALAAALAPPAAMATLLVVVLIGFSAAAR